MQRENSVNCVPDAPDSVAVQHCRQSYRLLAQAFVVAIRFRFWTISSSTMLAFVPLAARWCSSVFMLFGRCLKVSTDSHGSILLSLILLDIPW